MDNLFNLYEQDQTKFFIDIANMIKKNSILDNNFIESMITFGDSYFIDKNKEQLPEEKIVYDLYLTLKNIKSQKEMFFNECLDILTSLNIEQVKSLETIYANFFKINCDKILTFYYKDGFVFSCEVESENLKDDENVLQLKSFIAKALLDDAIVTHQYDIDKKSYVTGYLIKNNKDFLLKKSFVKKNFPGLIKKGTIYKK